MMTMHFLILEIFFHQVLSKVLDLNFRNHHLILMMKSVLTLKMVSILAWDPLDVLMLGAVRNCLNQLKKREESVFGQWSKIILGRISPKFVFQFILMSPSLLYRNVLKILNTHTFLIKLMNGVERYYSTKNLMVFLAFLKVGWLQITAHFLYFKFVLACTFFFFCGYFCQ